MNWRRGYSSGVEHSTADREVPGSIPGVPCFWLFTMFVGQWEYPDVKWILKTIRKVKNRGHPELNQGPLDLQSNALPLSYIPVNTRS